MYPRYVPIQADPVVATDANHNRRIIIGAYACPRLTISAMARYNKAVIYSLLFNNVCFTAWPARIFVSDCVCTLPRHKRLHRPCVADTSQIRTEVPIRSYQPTERPSCTTPLKHRSPCWRACSLLHRPASCRSCRSCSAPQSSGQAAFAPCLSLPVSS
jgi:hypothetical protein